jgi:hypothetical protein
VVMRTYIMFAFWISASSFVIRSIEVGCRTYPYQKRVTMGQEVAILLLSIPLLLWAAYLLWA